MPFISIGKDILESWNIRTEWVIDLQPSIYVSQYCLRFHHARVTWKFCVGFYLNWHGKTNVLKLIPSKTKLSNFKWFSRLGWEEFTCQSGSVIESLVATRWVSSQRGDMWYSGNFMSSTFFQFCPLLLSNTNMRFQWCKKAAMCQSY